MAKAIRDASGVVQITLGGTIVPEVGDLIGYNGTNFQFADANANPVTPAEFMVMSPADAADANGDAVCNVCTRGILYDSTAPFTLGAKQYLSATATTGNTMTATIPAASATLTLLQRVGIAISTDLVAFDLNVQGPLRMRITASVDPASANTDTTQDLAVTLTGVVANDYIQAYPPALVQGVAIQGPMVASTDTVTIGIDNQSAGTVNGGALTWTFIVTRDG